jgi:hypothetical protein
MKTHFLIAALGILSAGTCLAQQASPRAAVEVGATAYFKDGASAAVTAWLKGSALEGNTQATSQANSLRQIEDFYGKPESIDFAAENSISRRSKVLLAVINYENGPVFARFFAYQLKNGAWVLTQFQFQTEANSIFPEHAIYRRE